MPTPRRSWRAYPWQVIIPVAVYVVLVLAGVTQSSIGIQSLREDAAHPNGLMLGTAPAIRSDEYLTSTPTGVGVTATGSTAEFNPLAAPQAFLTQLPSGPVSSVVMLDGTILELGPVLPDQMLVAARWWLPMLLLFLGAPAFFRNLTGSRWIGWFAAALITLSPATAWWSFSPVGILGPTLAGTAALQAAARAATQNDGRRAWFASGSWAILAAILLAHTAAGYQPWVLMLVPAILLAAVSGIAAERRHRGRAAAVVVSTGVLTMLLVAGVLLENRAALAAVLHTVYPGARVSTGLPNGLQELFGATTLGRLPDLTTIVATNASEISSGFAICFVWVALLLARAPTYRQTGQRASVFAICLVSGFWLAWTNLDWGTVGSRIPLVNVVPPGRAADMLGYLAVTLLCLVLPGCRRRGGVGFSLLSASACALVAGDAGSILRVQNLPELSIRYVWLCALLLAVTVFLITLRPRLPHGYALGVVLALAIVWDVNPVLVGLGDLRDSDVAQSFLVQGDKARGHGAVWASDANTVDSLLIATGVPALSGRQVSGPEQAAWRRLVPDAPETVWNRGGSYVTFVWNGDKNLTAANPAPDVIQMTGSPCTVANRMPELTTIIASKKLAYDCLTEKSTFTWGGARRWVYAVAP